MIHTEDYNRVIVIMITVFLLVVINPLMSWISDVIAVMIGLVSWSELTYYSLMTLWLVIIDYIDDQIDDSYVWFNTTQRKYIVLFSAFTYVFFSIYPREAVPPVSEPILSFLRFGLGLASILGVITLSYVISQILISLSKDMLYMELEYTNE